MIFKSSSDDSIYYALFCLALAEPDVHLKEIEVHPTILFAVFSNYRDDLKYLSRRVLTEAGISMYI